MMSHRNDGTTNIPMKPEGSEQADQIRGLAGDTR